jgi:hypothetical protein
MSPRAPQYAPAALLMLVWPTLALSAEAPTLNMANTAWMLTATVLVFIGQVSAFVEHFFDVDMTKSQRSLNSYD